MFLVLGKAAGAVKEMAVAYRYGVSDEVDAYQFVMTMAFWLPATLVGVLAVVLIPVLVQLRGRPMRQQVRFVRELDGLTLGCAGVLGLAGWMAWPFVLDTFGAGLSLSVREMSRTLIQTFAPAAALALLAGIAAARLRARERHVNTLLDSVPALTTLACVMAAGANAGVAPLGWGTLLGYALSALCLVWLAARADGSGGAPLFSVRSPHWPFLMRAFGIMLIGQVAMSFVGPLDQYAAAMLGGNANATLGYAVRLLSLLLGIGAVSVGRAALPVLADVQARGDAVRARAMALKWSAWLLVVGLVVLAAGWLLAPLVVRMLFERGAFNAYDTARVAQVFRWGLLQLPGYFGVLVLVQLLASQNRYGVMAAIAVGNFALKALLNLWLAPRMGAAGIMLATACMYTLSYVCYLVAVWRTPASHLPHGTAPGSRVRGTGRLR